MTTERTLEWGRRIHRLRTDRGLSQHQFAAAVGATQGTVHRWETGKVAPRPDSMVAIAEWAGVDPDVLFSLRAGRDLS